MRFILSQNVLWGDALTLKTVGGDPVPLVFAEWSPVNPEMVKRRDFEFGELVGVQDQLSGNHTLFEHFSDQGKPVYLPEPIKDHPLVHFLGISDAE